MLAVRIHQTGPADVLRMDDIPIPVAGPGEMLVRTEASGVNFAETRVRSGAFLPMMPSSLPARMGIEAVGVVIAAGSGTDSSFVGRRILATNGNGTHAAYFTVDAQAITAVPDGVSATDAVAVGVQAATASALLAVAGLTGAEKVLVEAAGGGVGGYIVQLARESGAARVVATAGSPAKRGLAHDLGADVVVDHRDPNWTDNVRTALDGDTLDVVFESIAGPSARRLLDLMTTGTGRMLFYGQLSGPADITPFDLMVRSLTMVGCGSSPADYRSGRRPPTGWPARLDRARDQVLQRLAGGKIRPIVDAVIPLANAVEAHQRLENREAIGKIILVP